MRGKWVLAAGAVLALIVVGGVGGLTMRAFAGTAHTKVVTKTVTRLCVYVDHKDKGASYGDLSVVPKYDHQVCIAGKRGPAGPAGPSGPSGPAGNSSVITWSKTVAAGAPAGATHKGAGVPQGTVDLATVGPFTVRGYCTSPEGTEAITDVISGQDGSSYAWGDNYLSGNFNIASGPQQASNPADGSSQSPSFVNEYNSGEFDVTTADGSTAFTGFANNGVYIDGPAGPACTFTGYL